MDVSCGKCGASSLTHDGKPWCTTYGCNDDILTRPFQPSSIYSEDAHHTELVISDVPIVWVDCIAFDLGYDFDGALIAIRVPGDRTKRK
jgi:hypothetical protein